MKQIPLTQGQFAIVDDGDYEVLIQWKWQAAWCSITRSFYAIRSIRPGGRPNKKFVVRMHRQIMGAATGLFIDHISGNTLDNRRENLRVCTPRQNTHNQKRRSNNSSGYKGVSWSKSAKRWQARIMNRGVSISLGFFDNPLSAAKAYNDASLKYHGEFARPNDLGVAA